MVSHHCSSLMLMLTLALSNAQLMSYSAWPMQGRALSHTGNALIEAPNNSIAVATYTTGGAILSSPAVGADGTVYVGSEDNNLYAFTAEGKLKWNYTTGGGVQSSPAVGADGTVYVGSEDSNLHAIGLSDGHVTTVLHAAQLRVLRNQDAQPQLERICNLSAEVNFVPSCSPSTGCNVCDACCKSYIPQGPSCSACFQQSCPARNQEFSATTIQLVSKACQTLNNTRTAGNSTYAFVDPLSFEYYKGAISAKGTMMTLLSTYESRLADFEKAETTMDQRISAAQDSVSGYTADQTNWQGRTKRDSTTMQAYGTEIITLGTLMDSKYRAINGDVQVLLSALRGKMTDLQKQLTTAENAEDAKKALSFFGAIFKVVKALVAVATCYTAAAETAGAALLACEKNSTDDIKGAVTGVIGCVHTFKEKCTPCQQDQEMMDSVTQAEGDINALSNMAKAAQQLNAQLTTRAPLPEELPALIADKISFDSLGDSVDQFVQEIVKVSGKSSTAFMADLKDWCKMGLDRVQLFMSYYNLATRIQNDDSSLLALHSRTTIVQQRLQDLSRQEAAVVTGIQLVREQQQKQAMLVLKYLHSEWQQFRYFALKPVSAMPDLSSIPDNPSFSDILVVQQSLEQMYQSEIITQSAAGSTQSWVHIEVNQVAEPATLAAMRGNYTTTVVLPIPYNATSQVAGTRYYQMRVYDVSVLLLDAQGKPLGTAGTPVEVFVTKGSQSSFLNKDMELFEFTHQPVVYGGGGGFNYEPSTGCPKSVGQCGSLCPDYIRYSPYGQWTVQIYAPSAQGVDISQLAAMRFEFQTSSGEIKGPPCDLFGKPGSAYPQGVGRLCQHNDAESGSMMEHTALKKT